MENISLAKIVALAKRRGFIYPGSELYGGVANTYDYGPVGAELLRNIKNLWWEAFVHRREDIVGLEASLISHQEIWKASGHVGGFADALVDCRNCKLRMRADHLLEDFIETLQAELRENPPKTEKISSEELLMALKTAKVEGWSEEKMDEFINVFKIGCPNCSENKGDKWTAVRKFNLLFPVHMGIVEGDQSLAYLRGETAQGMFVNFKNVLESNRVKLPFGIAQLGKSFRNEITPGNSVFRTLEFEQGEIEFFFDPEESDWEELYETWKKDMWEFVTKTIGIKDENLRWRTHSDEERSFYSKRTEDLEYRFPFGFKELWGLAYRTDYDLSQHEKGASKDLKVVDSQTGKKVLPHVIEPAVGINRIFLMALSDAYVEEEGRTVLKLSPKIAPFKAAVFPLLANKPELMQKAREIYKDLSQNYYINFDARGNIGKRYLAQDEIGTPYCITVDFDTLEDDAVTVRDRDTMEQQRIKISELRNFLAQKLV
ncbi:MAG: glycine--tRNA ligase [Candidatus Levybacteria bacterium]|nr:glycine--tRNA ligase [Candidatus Levybacteria bacterium]